MSVFEIALLKISNWVLCKVYRAKSKATPNNLSEWVGSAAKPWEELESQADGKDE